MQKSNATQNADIKTPIDYLQFAERKQLQQTPSFKYGGGGARAARRIRILYGHLPFVIVFKKYRKTPCADEVYLHAFLRCTLQACPRCP